MLVQFENMGDDHLGSIKTVQIQRRAEIEKLEERPIHLAPYCAGPKAKDLENRRSSASWPWTLSNSPRLNKCHRSCLCERRMAHLASAPISEN